MDVTIAEILFGVRRIFTRQNDLVRRLGWRIRRSDLGETALKMRKNNFLATEYERIRAEGETLHSSWRESFEIFCADVGHLVPTYAGNRYFAPINRSLGYVPGNVEIRYRGPISLGEEKYAPGKSKAFDAAAKRAAEKIERVSRRREQTADFERSNGSNLSLSKQGSREGNGG